MKSLRYCLLLAFLPMQVHAQNTTPLQARAEVNVRAGHERSILMTEMWVPFAQDDNGVFYGNLRLIGDNEDNREGNLGIGYRQITSIAGIEGVVGGHAWIDRRKTQRGSKFNQVTLGAEWLGNSLDFLINAYIPLSDKQVISVNNPDAQSPTLVGTQIVVDTERTIIEEAQNGVDAEIGFSLPMFESVTDSIRMYVGGYYFDGPNTESVAGWRTRLATDITPDVQLGLRFQSDDERGSQGFLEATVRFPFGQKKSYREEGLRARLDDSPERDIDIVTNEAIIDPGSRKAIVNTETGQIQTVLHVDNTAAGGGDGNAETPFNSLAAAEAAAVANDIIYVHAGDGTATNQNAGITLNKVGQWLVGEGSDFIFDANKFSVNGGGTPTSLILARAGTAPVITNPGGNGIDITADQVLVSGITVDGTNNSGISALNNTGTAWESVTVTNVRSINNQDDGILVDTDGAGSRINNVTINSSTAENNSIVAGVSGVRVFAQNGGIIDNLAITNTIANNNNTDGIRVQVRDAGSIIDNVVVDQITVNDNGTQGTQIFGQSNGLVNNASFTNIEVKRNGSDGILMFNPGATIDKLTIANVDGDQNGRHGVWIFPNSGAINSATLNNIVSNNSAQDGIQISANGAGSIGGLIITNSTTTGNGSNGIFVNDDTTGAFLVDLGGGALGGTGGNRSFDNTSRDLRVDLDGGELKAENNWWGDVNGLDASKVTLDAGSTVDADPALTTDPNL